MSNEKFAWFVHFPNAGNCERSSAIGPQYTSDRVKDIQTDRLNNTVLCIITCYKNKKQHQPAAVTVVVHTLISKPSSVPRNLFKTGSAEFIMIST